MPPLHLHYERMSNKYFNKIYQILCWMDFTVPKVRAPTSTSHNTKKSYISLTYLHQSIYKELKTTVAFISLAFNIETSNTVFSSPLGFDMKQLLNKRILCSWDTSGYLPPIRNFFMSKLLCVEYSDISKMMRFLNSDYPSQRHKWCDICLNFYKKII